MLHTSNRLPHIHIPSTCLDRLCLSMLPTIQTMEKGTTTEQELQLGWISLEDHLVRRSLDKNKTFVFEHLLLCFFPLRFHCEKLVYIYFQWLVSVTTVSYLSENTVITSKLNINFNSMPRSDTKMYD